jgi:hypothetical protein
LTVFAPVVQHPLIQRSTCTSRHHLRPSSRPLSPSANTCGLGFPATGHTNKPTMPSRRPSDSTPTPTLTTHTRLFPALTDLQQPPYAYETTTTTPLPSECNTRTRLSRDRRRQQHPPPPPSLSKRAGGLCPSSMSPHHHDHLLSSNKQDFLATTSRFRMVRFGD